jgi:membrane associated rhomboid family serine protease
MTGPSGQSPGEGDFQWPNQSPGQWPGAPASSPGWGNRPPSPVPQAGPWPAAPEAQGDEAAGGRPGGASPTPGAAPGGTVGLGPNTRCYEHPDRLASAVCRSCNRPICTVCMVQAPVGWHCHQCVRRDARRAPVIRYQPGAAALPRLSRTPVTTALIVVNVLLFVVATSSNSLTENTWAYPIAMQNGGQWYRLFSSFFVTNSFLDVALNMWCLLIIGRLVEPALGMWRYLALYLLSGLGGSVAYYLLGNPFQPAAGASGAIFGLFGAYFILARRSSANTSGILALIGVNLAFSFLIPNVAWQAHVGGLVAGLAVAGGFGLARGHRYELLVDILTVVVVAGALSLLMLLPPGVINTG